MSKIHLKSTLTVGKVPEYNNKKYGKIQISSQDLAEYIGKKFFVEVIIHINDDE